MKTLICLILILFLNVIYLNAAEIPDNEIAISPTYKVDVRVFGESQWKSIPVYFSSASAELGMDASWITFPVDKPVEVKIQDLTKSINTLVIRPISQKTKYQLNTNTALLVIQNPVKLSIEVDGNKEHPLLLFADPPEQKLTKAELKNLVRFKAGVHNIGHHYKLKSNTTYYLEAGAYLKGSFYGDSTLNNVSIKGRGIINSGYQKWQHPDKGLLSNIVFEDGRNILIEGITCIEAGNFQIKIQSKKENCDITIRNVKLIGWNKNTDGIHVSDMDWKDHVQVGNAPGTRLFVQDCFIRANDDAILLCDGTSYTEMKDCIIWDDGYGATFCLSWGGHNRVDSCKVSNCTVIHKEKKTPVFRANHAGEALIQNVIFENITIEGNIHTLFGLRMLNHRFDPDPGMGSIKNLVFRNINLEGDVTDNFIEGFSNDHTISNIQIENLKVNGKLIRSANDIPLRINPFVHELEFRVSQK